MVMKKMLPIFTLGLCLTTATVLPAHAQPTLPQGPADQPCDQSTGSAESGDSEEHAVMATIKGIDRQRGILELETKNGQVVMETTPAETQSLQEGDQLLVCLEGDSIEGEDRLANSGR
jgi:hypothetical protein